MKSACLAFVFALSLTATVASAQTDTTFAYQGELKENGNPASGLHDFDFSLWDALSGGNQIGTTDTHSNVPVVEGKFTVELDFGANAFDNSDRWLEIEVNGGALSPRQPITRAPYSIQTRGIFVDDDGDVGIGTVNPEHPLDVVGEVKAGKVKAGEVKFVHSNDFTSRIFPASESLLIVNAAAGNIEFFTSETPSVAINRLTIEADGNVGIGTNSPKQRLHNVGDYYGRGHLYLHALEGDGSNGTAYVMARDDSGTSDIDLRLRTQSNGTVIEAFHIEADGDVGIGTSVPEFLLHVDGEAGKPSGGPWAATSDIRLKKNIETIDNALDTLLRLRGVTFEYIDPEAIHELPGQRIGMIAQEVEKVVPDWIGVRDDGYKTVTQRGFEALTVEALRELRAEKDSQIESQAKRLTEMERDNATLRTRFDSLKQQNNKMQQQIGDLQRLTERLTSTREESTK